MIYLERLDNLWICHEHITLTANRMKQMVGLIYLPDHHDVIIFEPEVLVSKVS